ncbi:hypothetical protein G6F66_014738 [Rhizopus arrhizus]|nr:hypothetical protein G6F66_014738 [Rhizopus arrhizus]
MDVVINQQQFIHGGKSRPLAVTSAQRAQALPDVPTVAESGFPGYQAIGWNGIFVPAGTPGLPSACCTLAISPLVRELIVHLADLPPSDTTTAANRKLADVLVEQLSRMPTEHLHLPLSDHPRLRQIASAGWP